MVTRSMKNDSHIPQKEVDPLIFWKELNQLNQDNHDFKRKTTHFP